MFETFSMPFMDLMLQLLLTLALGGLTHFTIKDSNGFVYGVIISLILGSGAGIAPKGTNVISVLLIVVLLFQGTRQIRDGE